MDSCDDTNSTASFELEEDNYLYRFGTFSM